MFIEKTIDILIQAAPLLIILGVVAVLTISNVLLVVRIERTESRSKGKTKYRTSDLWFDFLEAKGLKDIDIHEEDFAGYISKLNVIVVPSGTFSKRKLLVKFIVFHEAMHYYCNANRLFTHNSLTKAINAGGITIQLLFIPYIIIKSLVVGIPVYDISWFDISILFMGWVFYSVPLLIEEIFVSYQSYKFLSNKITMRKEYKKELISFAVLAWLSHFTVSPLAVVEFISYWKGYLLHQRANKAVKRRQQIE